MFFHHLGPTRRLQVTTPSLAYICLGGFAVLVSTLIYCDALAQA